MEKTRRFLFLTLAIVLTAVSVAGKTYQIKFLNTPTIKINNKEAKVGDSFDENAIVTWDNDQQAMRVISSDNHVYTVAALNFKKTKSVRFRDCIAYKDKNSTRGGIRQINSLIKKTINSGNPHIMLDELVIDFSSIEDMPDMEGLYIVPLDKNNETAPIQVSISDGRMSISRDQIASLQKGDDPEIYATIVNDNNKTVVPLFNIILLPLSL